MASFSCNRPGHAADDFLCSAIRVSSFLPAGSFQTSSKLLVTGFQFRRIIHLPSTSTPGVHSRQRFFNFHLLTRQPATREGSFSRNFKFPRSLNSVACLETVPWTICKLVSNCNRTMCSRNIARCAIASLVEWLFMRLFRTCHWLARPLLPNHARKCSSTMRIFHSCTTFFTFPSQRIIEICTCNIFFISRALQLHSIASA